MTDKAIEKRLTWLAEELEAINAVRKNNPGYVPTVRDEDLARALKAAGVKCWNSKTGKNW